jgi:hypothetical protein
MEASGVKVRLVVVPGVLRSYVIVVSKLC